MKKINLILLFLLVTNYLSAQIISLKTDSIVNAITLEYSHLGSQEFSMVQYNNYRNLESYSSQDELIKIAQKSHPIVQLYASWILADKNYSELYLIFNNFYTLTNKVYSSEYECGFTTEKGIDLALYERVKYYSPNTHKDSIYYDTQLMKFDSIILHSKKKNYLLDQALRNNKRNPNNYEIIRIWALVEKYPKALKELVKYQKQTDIQPIKELGVKAFPAISNMPHPLFWDLLLEYETEVNSLEYLEAISSFKNIESNESLKRIYKHLDKNNSSDTIAILAEALIRNYCVLYQDLILTIFKDYKTIDISVTKKLISEAPSKSSKYFSDGLMSEKSFNFLQIYYGIETEDKIIPMMLKNIKIYKPKNVNRICIKNIKSAKFQELRAFTDFAKENQLTKTQSSILNRLEDRNIPFEIYGLTEAILAFNNSKSTKKLANILSRTEKYWNKDNWSNNFTKLFKEYNFNITNTNTL